MKKSLLFLLTATLLSASPIRASETERIEDLEKRVSILEEEIAAIKGSGTSKKESKAGEDCLYDNGIIRVWFEGFGSPKYSSQTGYGINVVIENISEDSLEVFVDELSVDGFMVESSFIESISAGKKCKGTISVEEYADTEKIESVDVKFRYYYKGHYKHTDLITLL